MLYKTSIFLSLFFCFFNFFYAQKLADKKKKISKIDSSFSENKGEIRYLKNKINVKKSILLSPQIKETSGLIFFNDLLWTHNDDTDNHLYGIDTTTGKIAKSVRLTYLSNIDWEEISQDENYIYVGDIGNNKGNRKDLKIYRIEKNSFLEGKLIIDTIGFRYNLQSVYNASKPNTSDFDCEAFIISKDSIYLFTKEWSSLKTSIYSFSNKPGNHIAVFLTSINVKGLITGAVLNETKNKIGLCGYSKLLEPFVFILEDFKNFDFNNSIKKKIEINLPLHQIEGITTIDGENYFLSNENFSKSIIEIPNKIHFINLGID